MVIVEAFKGRSITEHRVEIVERKGRGHPDYMCDSIMEAVSIALSKEYLREFGTVLHHNIDKGLLSAGRVKKTFGMGRVIKPMELTIGDRATFSMGGKKIPVREIAVSAAKNWIKNNLRFVDPDKHIKYRIALAPGSEELADIFLRPGRVRCANDTSCAVGYYPLSPTEKLVIQLETYLNSNGFKRRFPETGEDIKVMALRRGDSITLTVAMPLIAHYIKSEKKYFKQKDVIHKDMLRFIKKFKDSYKDIAVYFNTLDEPNRGLAGVYLSLLGTSAEHGDSGQVGRGNRVNGIISMARPMGTEAAAGKNPVSHVGKIYNVLAHKIAKEIYQKTDRIKEVYVLLLSMIGTPIDKPQMATAQILLERGKRLNEISREAEEIFHKEFHNINKFCMELSMGKHPVC